MNLKESSLWTITLFVTIGNLKESSLGYRVRVRVRVRFRVRVRVRVRLGLGLGLELGLRFAYDGI